MTYIYIAGPDLRPVTQPVDEWTQLEAQLVFNGVGAGTFTARATDALMAAVTTPGNRVAVVRDRRVFMSGPVEKPGKYDRTATEPGRVTVNFASSEEALARRVTYPNPAQASTAQTVDYWTATAVNGETVMRNLVDGNAGPGALAARRIPGLVLGAPAGVGGNVTLNTRFDPLTDVLRAAAIMAGGLGWRVVERSGQLVFEVYRPLDRSRTVRFSFGLNNLRSLTLDPDAPTATVAIVGGSGDGAARLVVERTSSAAGWGRIEKFVNQSGLGDTTGLQQAGDAALVDAGEKTKVTAAIVDTPTQTYGRDYLLGDVVGIAGPAGTVVVDVVSAVKLTATPDGGELITPTFGGGDQAVNDNATVQAVRAMERRLGRLERK